MTLRSCGRDTVPITGPRSCAFAAPHAIGKACFAPGTGCDVRRMWSGRLGRVIAVVPETATARHDDGPDGSDQNVWVLDPSPPLYKRRGGPHNKVTAYLRAADL